MAYEIPITEEWRVRQSIVNTMPQTLLGGNAAEELEEEDKAERAAISGCFKQGSSGKGIILALIYKKSAIHQKASRKKNLSHQKVAE